MRVIKKYPNRRLYDTDIGRYITLDDIKQLVLDQVELQVVDARSQKDLTASTLLQIIAEQENITPIFTVPLLQNFIRFYNGQSQTLVREYLQQTMEFFAKQKELVQKNWKPYYSFMQDPLFFQKLWQAYQDEAKQEKDKG